MSLLATCSGGYTLPFGEGTLGHEGEAFSSMASHTRPSLASLEVSHKHVPGRNQVGNAAAKVRGMDKGWVEEADVKSSGVKASARTIESGCDGWTGRQGRNTLECRG